MFFRGTLRERCLLTPTLDQLLAQNGPQTTTPGQYVNVTPTATGTVDTSGMSYLMYAAVAIGLYFLFSGSHHR